MTDELKVVKTRTPLLPCAKCGGEPEPHYKVFYGTKIPYTRCKQCGHTMGQSFWDEEMVTERWNTWDRNE